MKTLSRVLIPCLVCLLLGCGEEQPERDYSRPPEYRNSAAEYLLSQQAKRQQKRRDEREKTVAMGKAEARAELHEIPADFPQVFTAFPDLEWRAGFSLSPVTMVTFLVSEPVSDAFKRLQDAAEADGWALEVVTEDEGGPQASFQKESQRVDVFVTQQAGSNTQVVAMLTELEPPPAAAAP